MTTWTPNREADLIRLWRRGDTLTQIRDAFGLKTTGPISGKVGRLQRDGVLEKRGSPIKQREPKMPEQPPPKIPLIKREYGNQHGDRSLPRPMAEPQRKPTKDDKWRCQWIECDGPGYGIDEPLGHNDSFKCGAKVWQPGASYCAEHHAMAYHGGVYRARDLPAEDTGGWHANRIMR